MASKKDKHDATAPAGSLPAAMNSSRWKKGQSGNPGGRPKLIGHVRELAQEQTEKSIKRLVQILDDEKAPHAAVVAAARELLDRGWGKATQPLADGSDDELKALFPSEIVIRGPRDVGS